MKNEQSPILPGATIGILGSGQLGRMLAIEARKMGYRVHTYSPDKNSPTGQIADLEVTATYDDLEKIAEFAKSVDVITFEFENVLSVTTEEAEKHVPVRPSGHVLHTTQNRLREKTFLSENGIPVTPFRVVRSQEELEQAVGELGLPCILKTAGFGYDGKGQMKIKSQSDVTGAFTSLSYPEAILEAFVDFELEISVVAARGIDGSFVHYGAVENSHKNHILDVTIAPARINDALGKQAVELSKTILEKLDVVGVLCTEYFVTRDGKLLVNELAPRPHNSGHYTFDACNTSQFEQQLRAVCGLPLGSPDQPKPAVMINLLGDEWERGTPQWQKALAIPGVKLHLYGKAEPRAGRKMGHMTAIADTVEEALTNAISAKAALQDF
jgi:5-(carboxyamino)imidazole ribonucleotide synthase